MEENYDTISLNELPISLMIVQSDFKILFANKQLHKLFGYKDKELIRQHVDILIPESVRPMHHIWSEEYLKSPFPKQMGNGRDVNGLSKQNTLVPVEVGLYPYKDKILVLIVDITIRKAKEAMAKIEALAEKINAQ